MQLINDNPFLEHLLSLYNFDLNKKNAVGDTALHMAVKNGKLDAISTLLKNEADVNSTNNQGETPLYLATTSTFKIKNALVQILLENGAKPNLCTGIFLLLC